MDGLLTEMRYFKLNLTQARNFINFVWIGDAFWRIVRRIKVSKEVLV